MSESIGGQRAVWSDARVEYLMGGLLRVGVILAATVITVGTAMYLTRSAHQPVAYHVFRGEPAALSTIAGISRSALAGEPRGIVAFGLLLLAATPVARVLFAVIAFARQRDRFYVAIALVVLLILLASIAGSR